jgi:hypothetical protein
MTDVDEQRLTIDAAVELVESALCALERNVLEEAAAADRPEIAELFAQKLPGWLAIARQMLLEGATRLH